MYFLILAFLIAITTTKAQISSYQPDYQPEESETSQVKTLPEYVGGLDYNPAALSLNLELPKEEPSNVPFYNPEPSSYLKAPEEYIIPVDNYHEYPVPAQDLQVPPVGQWNPNNDPNLYFEVVSSKSEEPTDLYPKKYNKEVHDKIKPVAGKPKEEITLVPISEKEFINKQNQLDKTLYNLAKKSNQKLIQAEKVDKSQLKSLSKTNLKEPLAEASGFSIDGIINHRPSPPTHFTNNDLVTSPLTVSLGYSSPSNSGERIIYQMHGHNGPHSYKWGYDTGKGHNRQFRFEERDNKGIVKGQYGYYDKHGKLYVVHYNSHPKEGFHAEGNFGKL